MSAQDQFSTAWLIGWGLTWLLWLRWARSRRDVTLGDVLGFGFFAILWPLAWLVIIGWKSDDIVCLKRKGRRG